MKKLEDNVFIITGVTPNYIGKATAFLNSVSENSIFQNILIVCWNNKIRLIDIMLWAKAYITYRKFKFKIINYNNVVERNSIFCLQNGEFVNALNKKELKNDPVIIFSDSDVIMQRSVNIKENEQILRLKKGDIMLGINEIKNELLIVEAKKLGAKKEFIEKISSEIRGYKVYNTGLLIARSSTFRMLVNLYNQVAKRFDGKFKHYAQLQWIICYVIQSNNCFNIIEMDSSIHSHCHRADRTPNPGTQCDNYGFIINSEDMNPVLFNHKYCDEYIRDKIFNSAVKYVSKDLKYYFR